MDRGAGAVLVLSDLSPWSLLTLLWGKCDGKHFLETTCSNRDQVLDEVVDPYSSPPSVTAVHILTTLYPDTQNPPAPPPLLLVLILRFSGNEDATTRTSAALRFLLFPDDPFSSPSSWPSS